MAQMLSYLTMPSAFIVKKRFRNAFQVRERVITFVQHFDIKYTNNQSRGSKGVGTVFPLKKH